MKKLTKRGRPAANPVPPMVPPRHRSLAGSIVAEFGDPYSTDEVWEADRS